MRIAFSGAHCTGKTSLVEELLRQLPDYVSFDEPYNLLVEEGYEFCHPPSLEDFEVQLERSIEILDEGGPDALFDRCPIDIVGYMISCADADVFAVDNWIPRAHTALKTLDLIVFVPIEVRDRIRFSTSDDSKEDRCSVDEKLRELLLDDSRDLDLQVLCVEGDLETRAKTVIREITAGR